MTITDVRTTARGIITADGMISIDPDGLDIGEPAFDAFGGFWPTHDPCGTNAPNQNKSVFDPGGAIFLRRS